MAITIRQSPTTPNMANNNLVYAVTSNSSSAPQYQFVVDLTLSGSNTLLQRIKQQPNPNNAGVFDMGSIITNYLDSDNSWEAAPFITASTAAKRFQVKFGEQYGTSASSSVILYTGVAAVTGSPAVTASSYLYTINGLVDPNDKINWNFPSASYFVDNATPSSASFSFQHALTNAPTTQSIQDGEYATISLINGNFTNSTSSAQDIFVVRVLVYNSASVEIDDFSLTNLTGNGGGPRANANQLFSAVATSQTAGTQLLTIGVGPQNLSDNGDTLPSNWSYYTVQAHNQKSACVNNTSGSYATLRYEKQGAQCGYDGVRFAWKNEFGVWDYYTFTLQTDKTTAIQREQYTQTFVDYSTPTSTVAYNKERRGIKQFYNKLTQRLVVNSNWLTQSESDWLKELFFSTNVFQQIGTEFFPIAIGSVELVERTNPRTQTTFQYVVEFQPANQPNPRL